MNTVTAKPTAEAIAQARDYIINALAENETTELASLEGIQRIKSILINGCKGYKDLSNKDLLQCMCEVLNAADEGGDDDEGGCCDGSDLDPEFDDQGSGDPQLDASIEVLAQVVED